MSKQSGKRYRYKLLHGEDADFVAYQRDAGNGRWQTISTWMVPPPAGHATHSTR